MGKAIDAKKFRELKAALKAGAKRTTVANRQGVSVETLRKVNLCKTYEDFQNLNAKKREAQSTTLKAVTTPQKDKRGFWGRLFNI